MLKMIQDDPHDQDFFREIVGSSISSSTSGSFFSGVINRLTHVKVAQGSKFRCHHV